MIRAYPVSPTVVSGERVQFVVDGGRKDCAVRFYRCGAENVEVASANSPERYEIPQTWKPGAYVGAFTENGVDTARRPDRTGATLDARSGRALFVVRPREPRARLLVVLPLFTYHAYNVANVDGTQGLDEGECLYTGAEWVTLRRPGGGIGGHPWDEVNADAYDIATPRQTFAHWDAKALAWLERNGYCYDLCTDLDLHDGSCPLEPYAAVASFGHHEYWSPQMRRHVEAFARRGGNVAFFGGNTMWFRIEFDPHRQTIRRDGKWNDEWKTTGVTYARGGGRWIGVRAPAQFHVVDPSHWLLAGMGLQRGDAFGTESEVVGYECDGAPPGSDLHVVAEASLDAWPQRDACGERAADGRASLGVRAHGSGEIFTASTADWARALHADDPVVSGITRNVLNRWVGRLPGDMVFGRRRFAAR